MSKFLGDHATRVYFGESPQGGNQVQSLLPRHKFNYQVTFTHLDSTGGYTSTLFETATSVQMPSVAFRTNTLNAYNRRVTIQTGVDYQPISIRLLEDRDGRLEDFIRKYSLHYYNEGFTVKATDKNLNSFEFPGDISSNRGYKLPFDKHFFEKIEIFRQDIADEHNVVTVYEPFIGSVDHDQLEYSNSDFVQYNLSLQYSGYNIETRSGNMPTSISS